MQLTNIIYALSKEIMIMSILFMKVYIISTITAERTIWPLHSLGSIGDLGMQLYHTSRIRLVVGYAAIEMCIPAVR